MTEEITPFVYWAQTQNQVTLKVDLTDAEVLCVNLEQKKLRFEARGEGARGVHTYGFTLEFHSNVDPDESEYKVIDRQVDFRLKKKCSGWWPRLTGPPLKPPWLKIDFDKWKCEDMDDEEEKRDICQDYPNLYDKLHKEEFGYRKGVNVVRFFYMKCKQCDGTQTVKRRVRYICLHHEDLKKVYLILYNLCQFVGFIYVLAVMGIRYSRDGPDSMKDTYAAIGNPMKFILLLQFLEVMHPLFGYTKGSALIALLQVGGRAFILFFMVDAEPRMQTKPVVFYIFLVWSTVEIVRYPYYVTQLLNVEIPFLTWLRYTIWMPLYPLGFLCEGIIVLRNIPYFEETLKFTVSLPNSWNFAFHFPSFMKLYLLILCIPGMYTMMSHMNHTRYKKLGKSNIKRKYT